VQGTAVRVPVVWGIGTPQVPVRLRSGQALHFAAPDFMLKLVASAKFMRLSLSKAARVERW